MKIPLSWLRDYVALPAKVADLEDALRMSGTEIERIYHPPKLPGVVVGRVLSVKKHPNADKLTVTMVDTGAKHGKRTIVCGAPNVRKGLYVAVALPGAKLPNGAVIKEVKVRGVRSEGMIASEDELGLSSEGQHGVLVIEKHPLGSPFEKLSGADTILDAEVTPNRADELGVIGIAREVAALLGKKIKVRAPKVKFTKVGAGKKLHVEVKDQKDCPRYTAAVLSLKGLKDSPRWLTDRLKNAGYRPINLAVDVGNYVMHEWGQPIHAFDLDKLSGRKIVVRRARAGERIVTLDGIERRLDSSTLVIADEKKPVAIAGVMGSLDSAVSVKTKNIVIESANFDPLLVRKGAKKAGLRTEAVTRFEKGIDPEMTEPAALRAAELIQRLSGASVYQGIIDIRVESKSRTVLLDQVYLNEMLGQKVPDREVRRILSALGFKLLSTESDVLEFEVPSFRQDVRASHDLVEEIARMRGFDSFQSLLPSGRMPAPIASPLFTLERQVKQAFVSLGFLEAVTFSFISKERAKRFGLKASAHILITNPLSAEHELMRTELVSSLVPLAVEGLKHKDSIRLFETANVYTKSGRKTVERRVITAVLAAGDDAWKTLKGILEAALSSFGVESVKFTPAQFSKSHPGRSAKVYSGRRAIGHLAELHPEFSEEWGAGRISYLTLDLESTSTAAKEKEFTPPPVFPSITYDLSVVVKERTTFEELLLAIGSHKLLKRVEFVESYTGKGLGRNKRSMTIRLNFNADKRTLEEEEAKDLMELFISRLKEKLQADIR